MGKPTRERGLARGRAICLPRKLTYQQESEVFEVDVTISGRHVDVTDAMEEHVRSRVDRLPRLDDQILGVTVTLETDNGGEQVEVIAKCHRNVLVTNSRSHNMYESIDDAFAKLERRISRLHDKLIEKRSR